MKFFKHPEWRRPLMLALLIAASALAPARAAIVPLNHIVAVVNDEVITRQELAKRYAEVAQSLSRQNTPLPARAPMRRSAAPASRGGAIQGV